MTRNSSLLCASILIVLIASCSRENLDCNYQSRPLSSLSYFRCLPFSGCDDTTTYEFEFKNCLIDSRYRNGFIDEEYSVTPTEKLISMRKFGSTGMKRLTDSISYSNGRIDKIYGFNDQGIPFVRSEFYWSNDQLQGGYTKQTTLIFQDSSYLDASSEVWYEFQYLDDNIIKAIEKWKVLGYDRDTSVIETRYEYSGYPNHVRFYHRTHSGRKLSISNAPLFFSKNFISKEIRYGLVGQKIGETVYLLTYKGDSVLIEESWDIRSGIPAQVDTFI